MVLPNFDWKSHRATPLSFSLPYFLPISSFQKIEESFNLLSIYNFFYEMFFGNKWYHKFVSSFMATTSFLVVCNSEEEKQENERQYVVWWTKTFKKVQPFSQEKLSSLLQLFLSCLNCLDKNLAGYCILNQGTFRYLFFCYTACCFQKCAQILYSFTCRYFFKTHIVWKYVVKNTFPFSLVH